MLDPFKNYKPKRKKAKAKKKASKKTTRKKTAKKTTRKKTARKKASRKKATRSSKGKRGYPPELKDRFCVWCQKKAREQDPTICTRKTCQPKAKRCTAKHPVTRYHCVEHKGHVWDHAYHADQEDIGSRWWWRSKTDLREPE